MSSADNYLSKALERIRQVETLYAAKELGTGPGMATQGRCLGRRKRNRRQQSVPRTIFGWTAA
jgi:hypothetical protein